MIMDYGIVISADFSEPGSPILAGPTEDGLLATLSRVAGGRNAQLAAVKELAVSHRCALVINHSFDDESGWTTTRKSFQRSRDAGASN